MILAYVDQKYIQQLLSVIFIDDYSQVSISKKEYYGCNQLATLVSWSIFYAQRLPPIQTK